MSESFIIPVPEDIAKSAVIVRHGERQELGAVQKFKRTMDREIKRVEQKGRYKTAKDLEKDFITDGI